MTNDQIVAAVAAWGKARRARRMAKEASIVKAALSGVVHAQPARISDDFWVEEFACQQVVEVIAEELASQ